MTSGLAASTSLYVLQRANSPVEWGGWVATGDTLLGASRPATGASGWPKSHTSTLGQAPLAR